MKKIGLIVNPVAGMGGAVGLKGTDGEMYEKSIELGATPVTPDQTHEFLRNIKQENEIHFLTAPGKMGDVFLRDYPFSYSVVGEIHEKRTTALDTIRIGREIIGGP